MHILLKSLCINSMSLFKERFVIENVLVMMSNVSLSCESWMSLCSVPCFHVLFVYARNSIFLHYCLVLF